MANGDRMERKVAEASQVIAVMALAALAFLTAVRAGIKIPTP